MTKNKWLVVAFFGTFAFGVIVGMTPTETPTPKPRVETRVETKTVTKEVTPQACVDALDLDNKIFTKTGEALNTFDFDSTTKYITDNTDKRTQLYAECYAKSEMKG